MLATFDQNQKVTSSTTPEKVILITPYKVACRFSIEINKLIECLLINKSSSECNNIR